MWSDRTRASLPLPPLCTEQLCNQGTRRALQPDPLAPSPAWRPDCDFLKLTRGLCGAAGPGRHVRVVLPPRDCQECYEVGVLFVVASH